ncbi:MAG: tetratricopeptide repeat protein, partial [Deltaproteobacteria bacterium]|nr:tetratricopeptide repeat protein [Deltaproteobacteria bacterium]
MMTIQRLISCALILLAVAFVGCNRKTPSERFEDLLAKASQFEKDQKLEEARLTLQSAVDANPDSAEGYYRLAEVMLRLKAFGRARELYQSALNIDPNHRDARLHLGAFLLAARQIEEAESHIRRLLEMNPNDVEARILDAGLMSNRKNFAGARATLEEIIKNDPKNATALASLGDVSMSEGKGDEAEALFRRSLEAKESSTVRLVLADLYMRQARLDESQKLLEGLVEAEPDNVSLRFYLGEFLLLRGSNDKAAEQYEKMIKTDPGRHDARDRMYDFALVRKDVAAAKALTAELEKADATDAGVPYFKGRDLEVDGKLEEALQSYIKALQGLPNFAPVFRHAGVLELQLGRTNEAVEHLNQAVTIAPNDIGARLALARHFFVRKDFTQSRDHLTRVLQIFPRHIAANVLRADIALIEGDLKSAEAVYSKLVELLPENPTGYLKLAILSEQKKEPNVALEHYRKALSFDGDVLLPANRFAELIAAKDGPDKAMEEVQALHDKSTKNKAEYKLVLASLRMRKGGDRAVVLADARKLVQEALEANPALLSAYFSLAQIDAMSGDVKGAIKNYSELVQRRPQHVPSRMLLAMNHERLNDFKSAAEQYSEILKMQPRFGPAANNLAWITSEELKGDVEEALRLAQIAKEELPTMSQST